MDYPVSWVSSVLRNFCEIPLAAGSFYSSIELQTIEKKGVTGFVAIMHLRTGGLDVLFEEKLGLDQNWSVSEPAMAHMEVKQLVTTEFKDVHCFVSAGEVDVQAKFRDSRGDEIKICVKKRIKASTLPLFTPAPPQRGQVPNSLRFLTMDVLHLLPRSSHIRVAINNVPQSIKYFLLPSSFAPFTSTRAGSRFILSSLALNTGERPPHKRVIVENDGLRIVDGNLWMEVVGLPKMDSLALLKTGEIKSGKFSVFSPIGELACGKYSASNTDSEVKLTLSGVKQNWFPGLRHISRLLIYFMRYRNRRGDYWEWQSSSIKNSDGSWSSVGGWKKNT